MYFHYTKKKVLYRLSKIHYRCSKYLLYPIYCKFLVVPNLSYYSVSKHIFINGRTDVLEITPLGLHATYLVQQKDSLVELHYVWVTKDSTVQGVETEVPVETTVVPTVVRVQVYPLSSTE